MMPPTTSRVEVLHEFRPNPGVGTSDRHLAIFALAPAAALAATPAAPAATPALMSTVPITQLRPLDRVSARDPKPRTPWPRTEIGAKLRVPHTAAAFIVGELPLSRRLRNSSHSVTQRA